MEAAYPDNYKLRMALSLVRKNKNGGQEYVQVRWRPGRGRHPSSASCMQLHRSSSPPGQRRRSRPSLLPNQRRHQNPPTPRQQDKIEEDADEFLDKMMGPTCQFYMCGLKRMYTSVVDVLERVGKVRKD
jgi:hypothetical protein